MTTFREAYKQVMLDREIAERAKVLRDTALAEMRAKMFIESIKNMESKNERRRNSSKNHEMS